MSMSNAAVRAPAPNLLWLEQRALLEFAAMPVTAPLLRRVRAGDGHPVLVLPGFTASDAATAPLRRQLRRWGYRAYGWRLGVNLGPTPDLPGKLMARLDAIYAHDERPVTLIGWSLGGIYARELARNAPGRVRSAITLAAPYRMTLADRSSLSTLMDRFVGRPAPEVAAGRPGEDERPALAVPATSIYTRTDGIVRWHTCIDRAGPQRENIEVRGSHSGLVFNPAVLYAIGDRLAQPKGEWKPFEAPRLLRPLFPEPVSWTDHPDRSA